jgi:hypothetical protein
VLASSAEVSRAARRRDGTVLLPKSMTASTQSQIARRDRDDGLMLQEIDDGANQDLWDELNQEAQTTDDLASDSHE